MLSIFTPAFNEADNLPSLYDRLAAAMAVVGGEWEWVIVDDHSRDQTFAVIERLAMRDARVRGLRLARNAGSHVAIACGLDHVAGEAAVMMAADLQDPPETLTAMLEKWRQGAQVVWAVRREQPGDRSHAGFAALYYWIMRRVVGMKEMPARGADFFLVDRVVIDAFRKCREQNVSVLALITWLGFRQAQVEYDKQARAAGQSGWTLSRKVKLVVDSVTAFSDLPIRLCSYAGLLLMAVAVVLLVGGMGLLLTLVVGLAGLQLLALGVVGEYVWRALDEARRRPAYLIEAVAGRREPRQAALMTAPARRECWQVGALALTSALVLAAIGFLNLFVAPSLAPRINVRWVEGVSDTARVELERQLKLLVGEHLEGTTWAYDLADPSPEGVHAIVSHASVEDTYHIDRALGTISADAPPGSTRLRGGLSAWRDAAIAPWLTRLAASFLFLSVLWLATTGRRAIA